MSLSMHKALEKRDFIHIQYTITVNVITPIMLSESVPQMTHT